jgi:hypothetical protein
MFTRLIKLSTLPPAEAYAFRTEKKASQNSVPHCTRFF